MGEPRPLPGGKSRDHPVSVPIYGVITRFGLRYSSPCCQPFSTIDTWRRNRGPRGLQTWFGRHFLSMMPACFRLSIWMPLQAIPWFGTNQPIRVDAARKVFHQLAFITQRGPELWSTKWRFVSISNSLNLGTVSSPETGDGINRLGEPLEATIPLRDAYSRQKASRRSANGRLGSCCLRLDSRSDPDTCRASTRFHAGIEELLAHRCGIGMRRL